MSSICVLFRIGCNSHPIRKSTMVNLMTILNYPKIRDDSYIDNQYLFKHQIQGNCMYIQFANGIRIRKRTGWSNIHIGQAMRKS